MGSTDGRTPGGEPRTLESARGERPRSELLALERIEFEPRAREELADQGVDAHDFPLDLAQRFGAGAALLGESDQHAQARERAPDLVRHHGE